MENILDRLYLAISNYIARSGKALLWLEQFIDTFLPKNVAMAACCLNLCGDWYCGYDSQNLCGGITHTYMKRDQMYCGTCYGDPPYWGIDCLSCGTCYQINCGLPCSIGAPVP